MRHVIPIFAPVATSAATRFISSAASGLTQGQSLKDAALSAIKPTLTEAITNTGQAIANKVSQSGKGRKRKRKSKKSKSKRVYKGAGKRAKRHTKPKVKKPKYPTVNF